MYIPPQMSSCARLSHGLFVCLLSAGLALAAPKAQAFAAFQAHRIGAAEGTIALDGVLDEAAWKKAPVFDSFYEAFPGEKLAAPVRTEVRLAYDGKYLYVGLKAHDPAPALLRAPFARRDKVSADQDWLALYIDPTGSKQSAQFIYVNPRGAISDGMYSDAGGEDFAPDFDIDVATARFEGGWSVELRIPFSALAYSQAQTAPWNLVVVRNMAREQRVKMMSGPMPRTSNCMLCYAEVIEGLSDLPSGWNWSATPQVVARRGTDEAPGRARHSFASAAFSLDLKVRPNPQTALDATIHPDFSQIELDTPQLSGNTNFGLFVSEKRPFFLEGSDMLQTLLRGVSTRAISNPAWGVRYTRRDAASDVTLLTALDSGGGLVQLPKAYGTDFAPQDVHSQATVARANLRFGALAVGALATDRSYMDGRGYNRVIGPDFSWQRNGDERLRGQLLVSATTAQASSAGQLERGALASGHAASFEWMRDDDNYGYYGSVEDVSDGFRADNGFFSQVGYRDLSTSFTKKFGPTGILNELNLYSQIERKTDRQGAIISNDYREGIWMQGPFDTQVNLRYKPAGSVRVARGGQLFRTNQIWGRIDSNPGSVFAHVSLEAELGDEVDVDAARLGRGGLVLAYAKLRPADRFACEASYSSSWIHGPGLAGADVRAYRERALQLNGIYHLGEHDTLRMTLQRSQVLRDPAFYAAPVAARQRTAVTSFVYTHAVGLSNAVYAGLTRSNGDAPAQDGEQRQNELFVKLSVHY
ncbi:MAG: DUF5916 domain-containing protein [Pseudomonadota bacterium]